MKAFKTPFKTSLTFTSEKWKLQKHLGEVYILMYLWVIYGTATLI
jgi:hypothetical protein